MRCIEINDRLHYTKRYGELININMRCIEIREKENPMQNILD